MKFLKGVTVDNLFNSKHTHIVLRVYQVLFALAVFCVTLFSISLAQATDRNAERRAEIALERMAEQHAERALRRAEQLAEMQVQRSSEEQSINSGVRATEQAVERQLEARLLLRMAEKQFDRMAANPHVTRAYLAAAEREPHLPTRPDLPEEPEFPDDPLDDGLGSFDPDEQDEPGEKGNDEIEEVEDVVEDQVEDTLQNNSIDSEFSDLQFEQALTSIHSDSSLLREIDEQQVWTTEWVIMADMDAKQALEQEGYEFSNEELLESFGSIIASVKAPASYDLHDDYQQVMERLEKHDAVLDFNHIYTNIYTNATDSAPEVTQGISPGELMRLNQQGIRIGMVDTAIDMQHRLLQGVQISQQHFTQDNQKPVFTHGTAVASVFSGKSPHFQGIFDDIALFNASVFVESADTGSITTALSLLRGLNWLVQQNIKVINMSLAGPPNRLLQKGIEQLCQQGIVIVAAAGNEGPFSEPMYPAGYSCAVAVTAVDMKNKLYKKAVRGNHIDVAAYGVDILAASDNNSTSAQSGTSIAAPFVTAWIASQLPQQSDANNWVEVALNRCIDLGDEGVDPLYGRGLLPQISHPLTAQTGINTAKSDIAKQRY
ncbi:S8 family serine peptidase [Planctobacterium marinum]|uniref:S8 family serine peptidase n=1 Tax=Planctobacterium marinum TaxID=1631968 RepID=UPI001E404EED|nr:S8 family serine peptidase [Planctobacterium marinum]MCC2606665.1 S8 family serine peptidase [Planctobacterium marinum]